MGGRLWAGAGMPDVPTTLVDGRLGPGVGVEPMPSWTAVVLYVELPVWMALDEDDGWLWSHRRRC